MLTGCFGLHIESSIPEQVAENVINIQPNETTRKMVRELLGDPIISSDFWNVEIYRTGTGHDVYLLYFILPISIPDVIGYIQVTYDENWIVSEYSSGFSYEDPANIPGSNELSLFSGGFTFISGGGFPAGEGSNIHTNSYIETLIAPETLDDLASITNVSEDECIMYLINEGRGYDVYLDGKALLYVPFISLGDVYFRVSAPPGEHVIELMPRAYTPKSHKHKFSCIQGQELYVHTNKSTFRYDKDWWVPYRNKMDVEVSDKYQEEQDGRRRRVIHHEGEWWSKH